MRKRYGQWVLWGALLVLLALDGVVYFVLVQPLGSPERAEKARAALGRRVEQAAATVRRLEQLDRNLPLAAQQLDRFVAQHFLAEEEGYSAIVGEFEGAAADVGVRPGRVDFRSYAVRERPELVRIEITTTVEGSYQNLLRFLEVLERSANFYLLERLELASVIRGGSLKLDLTLETYLWRGGA